MIPCTKFTRNNPGCRCEKCIKNRIQDKLDRRTTNEISVVRKTQTRKRANPWLGQFKK